jgi:hypothetical protein
MGLFNDNFKYVPQPCREFTPAIQSVTVELVNGEMIATDNNGNKHRAIIAEHIKPPIDVKR